MAVKILHKRSAVQFKNATGAQLELGELGLNYHESGPYLQCKDAAGEIVQLGGVYISSATGDAPGNPLPGKWWLRGDTLFVYDGAAWVEVGGTGGGGGTPGTITVIGGDGIEASTIGTTVTVTADINTSRGLEFVGDAIAVKLGTGLSFDGNGNIQAAPGLVNDGELTIQDANGTSLGTFSANQAVDETITIPAGFSGDYDDLTNVPDLPEVTAGDGVEVTQSNNIYTVAADPNTSRGIEINTDKIAAKLGSGLAFDSSGNIECTISGGLTYKGTVDVTSTTTISGAAQGDLYANTGTGQFSSNWATITSNATTATDANPGDWMVYQGVEWDHIPATGPGTDLGIDNRDATDLDVTSSTGADATIPAATTTLSGLMTAADKTALNSALQPGDDVSDLNNDAGYITDAGVTKIIAGTNVTINPTTGIGDVTINASGGGSGATDLGIANRDATDLDVTSSTGADATIPAATTSLAGLFTAADKTKLDGIEAGAEANVNADWDATSGDAEILNKPTLFTPTEADGLYLSKVNNDTAAGEITFEKLTTHEGGVDVVNAVINIDGSATFAGNVVVGDLDTSSTSGKGARIRYTPSGSNGNFGNFLAQCDGASPNPGLIPAIYAYNGTNQVAAINFDGSAQFDGNVTSGNGDKGSDTLGAKLLNTGRIQIHSLSSDSDGKEIFQTYRGGSSTPDIKMLADGSAVFAGEVLCDVTNNAQGLRVRGSQAEGQNLAMFVDSVGVQKSRLLISCSDEGVTLTSSNSATTGRDLIINTGASNLKVDGSATFAGEISVGSDAVSTNGAFLSPSGVVRACRDGSNSIFVGRSTTEGLTSQIDAEGSATFAGDVASEAQISAQTFLAESAYSSTLTGDSLFSAKGDYTANAGGFYPFRFLPTEINKDTPASSQLIAGYSSALNILKTANSADRLHAFAASGLTNDLTSGPNIKEVIGYYSNVGETAPDAVGNPGNYQAYNFFAEGSASNYFAGDIDCDGLINGAFSLRMESDDPAAFQTTYSTDEEGNEVEKQTYIGTTEDLLSIIKDLRARVDALEAQLNP